MKGLERELYFMFNENVMFFECVYSCDNVLFL